MLLPAVWKKQRGCELSESGLAMYARTLIRKEWFTAEELDDIRMRETALRDSEMREKGKVKKRESLLR